MTTETEDLEELELLLLKYKGLCVTAATTGATCAEVEELRERGIEMHVQLCCPRCDLLDLVRIHAAVSKL